MYVEIIDDNTQLANYVRKSFEKRWHAVEVYDSRKSFLHDSHFKGDLFLMDINLWDGNGLDMVEHLRVVEKVCVPIIVVSGQIDAKVRREGLRIWASGFIEKPFSAGELHEEVSTILDRLDNTQKNPTILALSEKEKAKLFKNA